jgi:hypothetical protein
MKSSSPTYECGTSQVMPPNRFQEQNHRNVASSEFFLFPCLQMAACRSTGRRASGPSDGGAYARRTEKIPEAQKRVAFARMLMTDEQKRNHGSSTPITNHP